VTRWAPTAQYLPARAHTTKYGLQGTDAAAKNEILHARFGINYNNLPEQFKKVLLSQLCVL
jgi:tRNA(His) 5'-end guanylyltransferase